MRIVRSSKEGGTYVTYVVEVRPVVALCQIQLSVNVTTGTAVCDVVMKESYFMNV